MTKELKTVKSLIIVGGHIYTPKLIQYVTCRSYQSTDKNLYSYKYTSTIYIFNNIYNTYI